MYHSFIIDTTSDVTFNYAGSINTYDDWFVVPDGLQIISNPQINSNYVDVPGASGSIDATEWLTGFPTYKDREGELNFIVLNDHGLWTERRNEINRKIHGKRVKLMAEDEQDYYYIGRLMVNDWKSKKDWANLTVKYRLEPYKYSMNGTTQWLWDPFNFKNGQILDTYYTDIEAGTTRYFRKDLLPTQPSYGALFISGTNENGLTIRFINQELGIDITSTFTNGSAVMHEWLFSNLSGSNVVSLSVSGRGKVTYNVIIRSI